jgi:hypothetical protein
VKLDGALVLITLSLLRLEGLDCLFMRKLMQVAQVALPLRIVEALLVRTLPGQLSPPAPMIAVDAHLLSVVPPICMWTSCHAA